MLPILCTYADRKQRSLADVRQIVARSLDLTDADIREMLPSGHQTIFVNRISWSIIHMERARLLHRVGRGVYVLTQDGEQLLARNPVHINIKTLQEYPAYANWRQSEKASTSDHSAVSSQFSAKDTSTPEEDLAKIENKLTAALQADLLTRIRVAEPTFLERIVLDLLSAMGYGGGNAKMTRMTGGTGDHGIDGVIREDALGLDEVYIQAKRYAEGNNVGEGDLRNFAGAIDAAGTAKGVFVTTSNFTPKALEYVRISPKRIILINGGELVSLMVRYNIGVRVTETYAIKRIDNDYFDADVF